MRRLLAHANFYFFILINMCVSFCVGSMQSLIPIFFFNSSDKSTHRRRLKFALVWPTHKPPQLRHFYVGLIDEICVCFAWTWPTQCALHSLTNDNFHLFPRFFHGIVGPRKSDYYASIFALFRSFLTHETLCFSCNVY